MERMIGQKPRAARDMRNLRSHEDDVHDPQQRSRARGGGSPHGHVRGRAGGFSAQDSRFKRQAKSRRLTAAKRA